MVLRLRTSGVAVLEAAFTLPLIMYMIFFIIESIQINAIQEATDAAAVECSLDFMATKCDNEFAVIMKKHMSGIKNNLGLVPYKQDRVSWTIVVYTDFNLDTVYTQFTNSPTSGKFQAFNDDLKGKPFVLTCSYKHQFATGYIKSKLGKTDGGTIRSYGIGVL